MTKRLTPEWEEEIKNTPVEALKDLILPILTTLFSEIDALRSELSLVTGQRDDESHVLSLVVEERARWRDECEKVRHERDAAIQGHLSMEGQLKTLINERDDLGQQYTCGACGSKYYARGKDVGVCIACY